MSNQKIPGTVFDIQKPEVTAHHLSQLKLCDRLEKLADSLPNGYDKQECLSICWALYPTIKAAHEFEEQRLFPCLLAGRHQNEKVFKSIERLRFEHWEDESYAEELSAALRQLVYDPAGANIDKLSYMLRGFFDGMRRHIAFEVEYIIPLLESKHV